jgi:hypothetical protein
VTGEVEQDDASTRVAREPHQLALEVVVAAADPGVRIGARP